MSPATLTNLHRVAMGTLKHSVEMFLCLAVCLSCECYVL